MSLKGKAPEEVSAINVTPLVDVMLVLLIIFMVIAPLLQNNVTVNMVNSRNAIQMDAANKTDAAIVAITRDGAIYFRKDRIEEKEVTSKIKDNMENKTDKTVFLRCDVRAKYGEVETVVDDIRNAGVENLAFLTQQNDETPPGPPPPTNAAP